MTLPRQRPLEPGMHLRGFRLEERLGQGGDGDVWAAVDTRGQRVAVKARPRTDAETDRRILAEFERLRTLRLPNVVRVLSVDSDQGYVFFSMELAPGQPWDRYVAQAPSLEARVRRAAWAGAGVARALAGIHRLRLTHRDIKPANVLVEARTDAQGRDAEPGVVVLDFGTSRLPSAAEEDEGLIGTPHYMAPEQRIGLPQDERVDLYALGVALYEVLSGRPARGFPVGRPRPALALLGAAIPRALSDLVHRLLALDPAERPPAEEAQDILERVASDRALPPAPWPSPAVFLGEAARLLEGSAVVVGRPGSGRRRLVQEARIAWYQRGGRSLAGTCSGDRPWGALATVLAELIRPLSPEETRALLGPEADALGLLLPGLLPSSPRRIQPRPEPAALAAALARVFQRAGPLAIVLWSLDEADPGTARLVPLLARQLPPTSRLWATSRRPGFSLRSILPPPWGPEAQQAVLDELVPGHRAEPAETPLQSCALAWDELARRRGEPGPALAPPDGIEALCLLESPFPRRVAELLCPRLAEWLAQGHVQPDEDAPTDPEITAPGRREPLRLADPGTRALALARLGDPAPLLLAASAAWRQSAEQDERIRRASALEARAGRPSEGLLRAAIREEMERGRLIELQRWLRLLELHHPSATADFELNLARLLADLELRPGAVTPAEIDALIDQTRDRQEEGRALWLRVVHEARRGDRERGIALGEAEARAQEKEQPGLAADMLREVALARLAQGDTAAAVRDAQRALAVAREEARRGAQGDQPGLGRREGAAITTLSATLLYAGRVREAAELCAEGATRCRMQGQARGEGALMANRGVALLILGQRAEAEAALARAREVQPRHRDPVVLATTAVTQARLAVERGDLQASALLVAEGLSAAEAIGDSHLIGEAWCVLLEAAVHRADPAEAQRALSAYGAAGVGSPLDHWPAVLARWRWLTGDLRGALVATDEPRDGHGELCIRAERSRLWLIAGEYDRAGLEARALAEVAQSWHQGEIARFARLVEGAARACPDEEFQPLLRGIRASRWTHLYLGAIHLDAIRRRLRGENVDALLRQLRARSADLGHQLYGALARAEGW